MKSLSNTILQDNWTNSHAGFLENYPNFLEDTCDTEASIKKNCAVCMTKSLPAVYDVTIILLYWAILNERRVLGIRIK